MSRSINKINKTKFKQTEIGEIPEDWERALLSDFFIVKNGKSDVVDTDLNGIYPFFDRSSEVKRSNRYLFDCAAIIIPGEGKEFVPRFYKGKFDLHQRAYAITSKKIGFYDDKFLYYWLLAKKDRFSQIAVGSTVKSLRLGMLTDFPVVVPKLKEQQQIATILSSLDDKIELNRKMNRTLEEIGKALFKRWFVDFEFPDENGRPYKSSGGKMVDSELGKIPEGWEVKTLDEIAEITIGRTPPRMQEEWFSTNPRDIKWISIKDMADVSVYIHRTAEYLTKDAIKRFNIPVIPKNTVIVSFKLTVGRLAITTEEMLSNEAIAHIKTNYSRPITPEFIYLALKNFDFNSLGSTSSIATAVNSKSIRSIPFTIPKDYIFNSFNKITEDLFERIRNSVLETEVLTKLRDSLLPRLMSGRLRVKN